MKKIIILTLFLVSFTKIFACKCMGNSFAQQYLDSDIVALVTIEKTYGDKNVNRNGMQMDSYSADLKFEKIYKGVEFKTLNIFGTTVYASSGACEKLVKKGEKYLILLSKNNDGEYYVSSCNKMSEISDEKHVKEYEDIFNIIERNKAKSFFIKFADYDDASEDYNIQNYDVVNDFSKLNDKRLKNKFGIYKVEINNDGKILKITPIEKIGVNEEQIQKLMKENFTVYNGLNTNSGEYLLLLKL